MTMPDLQQYHWNLYLSKNVEDTIDFISRKVFNSYHFSIASYKQEMRNTFVGNLQMKLNSLKKLKHKYHSYLIRKSFKGFIVNRALPSLHWGSRDKLRCIEGHVTSCHVTSCAALRVMWQVTLTVPLNLYLGHYN